MPFISTKTNQTIKEETAKALKEAYASAIELLPGKTEKWLMLSFEDGQRMAFRGSCESELCYIEVNLLGAASREAYDRLTAKLCELVSETLGVPTSGIYVKYEEAKTWGYDGFNF